MKKNIILILALVFSANVFAQQFDPANLRAGAGLVYASEINNLGLTFNGVYTFNEVWEGSVGFSHIFEKNMVRYNIVDLDAHYIFYRDEENLSVYGLAGLGFTSWKVTIPGFSWMGNYIPETTATDTEIGLNLGVGLNYRLTERLNLSPQLRYTIMDGSYLRIGASVQYLF
jgi:opacity protein-like surface antigen